VIERKGLFSRLSTSGSATPNHLDVQIYEGKAVLTRANDFFGNLKAKLRRGRDLTYIRIPLGYLFKGQSYLGILLKSKQITCCYAIPAVAYKSLPVVSRIVDHGIYQRYEEASMRRTTDRHFRETLDCNCVKTDEEGQVLGPSHFDFGEEDNAAPLSLQDHFAPVFVIMAVCLAGIGLTFLAERKAFTKKGSLSDSRCCC